MDVYNDENNENDQEASHHSINRNNTTNGHFSLDHGGRRHDDRDINRSPHDQLDSAVAEEDADGFGDCESSERRDSSSHRRESAFPFFQMGGPVRQTGYAYGDPMGGSYPDLPLLGNERKSSEVMTDIVYEDYEGSSENQSDKVGLAGEAPSETPGGSSDVDQAAVDVRHALIDLDDEFEDPDFIEDAVMTDTPSVDGDDQESEEDEPSPSRLAHKRKRASGTRTSNRTSGKRRRAATRRKGGSGEATVAAAMVSGGSGDVRKGSRGTTGTRGRGPGRPRKTSNNPPAPRGRPRELREEEIDEIVTEDAPPPWIRRKKKKAAEPSAEFKELNAQASKAWTEGKYEEALRIGLQAVNLNPEVFPLHGLISEILLKLDREDDAIGALLAGAHASNDVDNWWYVVNRLKEVGSDREKVKDHLLLCYSSIVTLDHDDLAARKGRLAIYRQRGHFHKVQSECIQILRRDPKDGHALKCLAMVCKEMEDAEPALEYFKEYLDICRATNSDTLDWKFLADYVDLLHQALRYDEAILVLRSTSRWLVGRGREDFWDRFDDDREWDIEDEPRRLEVPEFHESSHDEEQYGLALPVELRVKLGLLRLSKGDEYFSEAMMHFGFLRDTTLSDDDVVEYRNLYRDVGDALREADHHREAIEYYETVTRIPGLLPPHAYFLLAISYEALSDEAAVRRCINQIQTGQIDDGIDYQIGLAKLYQAQGKEELLWKVIWNIRRMAGTDRLRRAGLPIRRRGQLDSSDEDEDDDDSDFDSRGDSRRRTRLFMHGYTYKPRGVKTEAQEIHKDMVLAGLYAQLKAVEQNESEDANEQWLRLAATLFDDFRNQKRIFTRDKLTAYMGFAWEQRMNIPQGDSILDQEDLDLVEATSYRNISLDDWTNLICEYALRLAKADQYDQCWDVLDAAKHANFIYQNAEKLRLVRHVTLCCALFLNDEKLLVDNIRAMVDEAPYAYETHQLFSTATRLIRGQITWFASGPEQKYIMRRIKDMDYHLLSPAERKRGGFTVAEINRATGGEPDGNPFNVTKHSPTLLVLYGHMMLAQGSSASALSYYMRAYACTPDSAMLNLCVALAYMGVGFKRQADDRQLHVQLALGFLQRYRQLRAAAHAGNVVIRQEIEFNTGLFWHMMGVYHLALDHYEQCFALNDAVLREAAATTEGEFNAQVVEHFAHEAAFAAQGVLCLAGNARGARKITEEWLVL